MEGVQPWYEYQQFYQQYYQWLTHGQGASGYQPPTPLLPPTGPPTMPPTAATHGYQTFVGSSGTTATHPTVGPLPISGTPPTASTASTTATSAAAEDLPISGTPPTTSQSIPPTTDPWAASLETRYQAMVERKQKAANDQHVKLLQEQYSSARREIVQLHARACHNAEIIRRRTSTVHILQRQLNQKANEKKALKNNYERTGQTLRVAQETIATLQRDAKVINAYVSATCLATRSIN